MNLAKRQAAGAAAMQAAAANERFKKDIRSGKYNVDDAVAVAQMLAAMATAAVPPPQKPQKKSTAKPPPPPPAPISPPEMLVSNPVQPEEETTEFDYIVGPNGRRVAVPIKGNELYIDEGPAQHLQAALEKLDGLEVNNTNNNNSNSSSVSIGGSARSESDASPTVQLSVNESKGDGGISPTLSPGYGTTTGGFMPAAAGLTAEGEEILEMVEKILGQSDDTAGDESDDSTTDPVIASAGAAAGAKPESETGELGALMPGKLKGMKRGLTGKEEEDGTKIGTKTGNGAPFEPVPIGTRTGNGRWLASESLLEAGAAIPEGFPVALLFAMIGLGGLVVLFSLARRKLRREVLATAGGPSFRTAPVLTARPVARQAWGVKGAGLVSLKRCVESQRKLLSRPFDEDMYPVDEFRDFYVEESSITHSGSLEGDIRVEVAAGLIAGLIDPDTIHSPLLRPRTRYAVFDKAGNRWLLVKTDETGKSAKALAEIRPGSVLKAAVLGPRFSHGRYELLSSGKWVPTDRAERLVLRLIKRPGSAGAA